MENGNEMVTIRLPKALCVALAELANHAGSEEDLASCLALEYLFRLAAEKVDVALDGVSLDMYKPRDREIGVGGWDRESVSKFDAALTDALVR